MSIKILIDSAADYNPRELKERGFDCMHIGVHFGDKTFRDGLDLPKKEFYTRLMECETLPTTSQPPIGDYLDYFEKAKEAGDAVICITISSGCSGTYQSACSAKEMTDYPHIYVIDSKNVTASIQLIADYAWSLSQKHPDATPLTLAGQIAPQVERLISRVRVFAAVDTLDYLYKGGRLSKFEAKLGTLAQIKPLVSCSPEGKVYVVGKSMGKKKAMQKLLQLFEKHPIDRAFPIIFFFSYQEDNCKELMRLFIEAGMDISGGRMCHIGTAIGTHVGPNAFGFTYVEK